MPIEIKSYQCHGCKKLVPSTSRYLKVAKLDAQWQAAQDDNDFKKTRQLAVALTDVAFCDQSCLSEFVQGSLPFVV